jgi:hypothetical protein
VRWGGSYRDSNKGLVDWAREYNNTMGNRKSLIILVRCSPKCPHLLDVDASFIGYSRESLVYPLKIVEKADG